MSYLVCNAQSFIDIGKALFLCRASLLNCGFPVGWDRSVTKQKYKRKLQTNWPGFVSRFLENCDQQIKTRYFVRENMMGHSVTCHWPCLLQWESCSTYLLWWICCCVLVLPTTNLASQKRWTSPDSHSVPPKQEK